MKKLVFYLFAFIVLAAIYSCYDDSGVSVKDVPEQSIEEQMLIAHEAYLHVLESNPNAKLQFSKENDEVISKVEILKKDTHIESRGSCEVKCKGSGIEFIKCVKRLVDKEGCAVIQSCAYCACSCE